MLVLKWSKVYDGVQLIKNRLQQDVQLHSEFKGKLLLLLLTHELVLVCVSQPSQLKWKSIFNPFKNVTFKLFFR